MSAHARPPMECGEQEGFRPNPRPIISVLEPGFPCPGPLFPSSLHFPILPASLPPLSKIHGLTYGLSMFIECPCETLKHDFLLFVCFC